MTMRREGQQIMSEEPETPEEIVATKKFFSAARAIVKFLRKIEMDPQETIGCLSTSIAIAIRQSGTPWGPPQLKAIADCIKLELDRPVAEATLSPEQPHP